MTGVRLASISIIVTLASASACLAGDRDDGIEDEAGDGDPGDGDGDPGDGDGETGDGDGDDELDMLSALCEFNCAHFFNCAPAEFGERYANPIECRIACVGLFSGCVPEATNYLNCFTELGCADVILAATEGPAVTACGPVFAAAEAACGGD